MISDVLFEALAEIERYQTDPIMSRCYSDAETKRRIAFVTTAMRDLLRELDAPPGMSPLTSRRWGRGRVPIARDGGRVVEESASVATPGESRASSGRGWEGGPGGWEEDPAYAARQWQDDVANGDTRIGYIEWVEHQRECADHEQLADVDSGGGR